MFEENVKAAAEKYRMFDSVNTVYVGLSGGADSVSLLLVLNALKSEYGFSLKAIHINHHIRGEESDRDQHFCEELCKSYDIPLEVHHVDALAFSKNNGYSVEEGARKLRYEIFENIPEDSRTATAHTLNDSAETVLFNLARGTGLKGLTGIPPVRDKIIRPLIFCTRAEVEEYLNRAGQDFVTDSTNLTEDYSRNKIRRRIVPLMEELHGGFEANIRRMTENLSDDEDFLQKAAENSADEDLRTLHPAVRKRVIINKLKSSGIEFSAQRIRLIENALENGGKVNLSGDIYAILKNGRLNIETIPDVRPVISSMPAKVGENRFFCDKSVIITENNCEKSLYEAVVHKKLTKDCLDCDKIQGDAVLRSRQEGDGYIRAGRNYTSSLRKLINERCSVSQRGLVPVLADEAGIIWVQGFGIAERVKVDENTKKVWIIETKQGED